VIKHIKDEEKWTHVEPAAPLKDSSPTSSGGNKKRIVVKNGKGMPQASRNIHTTRKKDAKKSSQRKSYDVQGGWGNPFEFGASNDQPTGRSKKSTKKPISKSFSAGTTKGPKQNSDKARLSLAVSLQKSEDKTSSASKPEGSS
jgi:hypothetical protein